MSSYEVKHNVKGREFYIALEKGLYIPRYINHMHPYEAIGF